MNNYYQGLRALDKGEYGRAIGFFSRALLIDAADIDSQAERGFAHLEVGEFEEAHRDCQAVLRRDASHVRGCELLERLSPENSAEQVAAAGGAAGGWLGGAHAGQFLLFSSAPTEGVFGYEISPTAPDAELIEPIELNRPIEASEPAPPVEPAHEAAVESEAAAESAPAEARAEQAAVSAATVPEPSDEYGLAPPVSPNGSGPTARLLADTRRPDNGQPAAAPASAPAEETEETAAGIAAPHWNWRSAWVLGRAGMISALVHAAVLVALAMAVVHTSAHSDKLEVLATSMPASSGKSQPFSFSDSQDQDETGPQVPLGSTMVSARLASAPKIDVSPKVEAEVSGTLELALNTRGIGTTESADLLREFVPRPVTVLSELRSEEGRRAALVARGGTPQSEAAVNRALDWLVRHQNYDGSWNFDHRFCGNCKGACGNPGSLVEARVGATALALLPFLGAGHSHVIDKYGESSKYAKTMLAGLRFLMHSMRRDGGMNEAAGRMYDHGLASIVFCEAYGMTQDRMLLKPAERALAFIVAAQDPIGGGWRYQPQMPGDTSVVGWQLMAIKSGQMAYLRVPPYTIEGASRFLDSVAMDQGAGYGYVNNFAGSEATSAVGLLCRMYLGWKHDNPALVRGAQTLAALEPSTSNMYFNYYATQVLHHFEGPLWVKWNDNMRDYLVRSQSDRGHETGSWFFDGDRHGSRQGGRLYATCMAAMTLEVYYHHMPLYSNRAVHDKLE